MKRMLLVLLALILLLAGCATASEPETTETAATEFVDPGIYIPDSAVEQQTNGAVLAYALEENTWYTVTALGNRVLMISGKGETLLQLISGENGIVDATAQLPVNLSEVGQVLRSGVAYYDKQTNEAVFLDSQLAEVKRMPLPENIQGNPVFAPDCSEIFYCVGGEIRGMDTQYGVSRLIKSQSCESQSLSGIYFDGKLLRCDMTDTMWKQNVLYVSTENGMTVSSDKNIAWLDTCQDQFLLERTDGTVRQWIFGNMEGELTALNVQEDAVYGAAQLGGILGVTKEGQGFRLSFYDRATGTKTATVTVDGFDTLVSVLADSVTDSIWLLVNQGETQTLLRWKVNASAVTEETVYSGPVFTAEKPDSEGLKALQKRVDSLNRQHGTTIRIWNNAVKTTEGHTLIPEYQTAAIEKTLNELEQVLSAFPDSFLSKSVNTTIRICIVRTADGGQESIRFWNDGDAFVILPCGVDVETAFMRAMGYIVDSHSLGNSPMLDQWQSVNPEGFTYGEEPRQELLEGQTRAFADTESMSALTEDRARLFYEAMQPDNGAMFESEIMQAKLLLMCQAIRDAWRWERKSETYPWEQYLTQSIAYTR